MSQKRGELKIKILNKFQDLLNRFNSTAVLLVIGPFLVLAIINEIYLIAVFLFLIPLFIAFLHRSKYYIIFIPPLLYVFYQFILLIVVPFFVSTYNLLESTITSAGALLGILLFCIVIIYLAIRIPALKLWQVGRVSPAIILAKGLGALLIVFILEPIISLITSEDLSSLANTSADPNVLSAIWLSIGMAFLATLVSVLVGVPLGYLLARRRFAGRSFIQGIIDVPVVIPHTVAGIALLMVFGVNGVIGTPLAEVGVKFVDAWPGIVVAMMFVSVPFIVNSARDGFMAVDPRLENVARSLGATRTQAFSKVALRLSVRPIITGAIMSWARAISEFGAIIILVYFPMVASTLIYDRFTSFGLVDSRPIAVLLILVCLTVFVILRIIMETGSPSNTSNGGKP